MDKDWSGLRSSPLETHYLKTMDPRTPCLPGSTQISRHSNSIPDRPKVRGSPSSEPSIPGACSPAAARIRTNPSPNTRICSRGRGQPGAMIAGPAATAVCFPLSAGQDSGLGPRPAPAFRGGALAFARPNIHSELCVPRASSPLTSHSFNTVPSSV